MSSLESTCANCANFAKNISATDGCCVTGRLKARLFELADARSKSEDAALRYDAAAQRAEQALKESESRVLDLSKQNEELRIEI